LSFSKIPGSDKRYSGFSGWLFFYDLAGLLEGIGGRIFVFVQEGVGGINPLGFL
jgi:hypothetical protein